MNDAETGYPNLQGKSVLIVEDAAAFSLKLESQFLDVGSVPQVAGSFDAAINQLESGKQFDVAIVDMYIPQKDGGRDHIQRGEQVCAEIRKRYRDCIIIGVSAHMERAPKSPITNLFSAFFFKDDIREDDSSALIFETLESLISANAKRLPRVFIVHGHDDLLVAETKDYIQNSLKFPEPIVLRDRPDGGKTIIEKFEKEARRVDIVIVCLSPDDEVAAPDGQSRRSRQNVIFETGFFYGQMRRNSGRIILLVKGDVELPSDISGVVYLDVSAGVSSQSERIRKEFMIAGFKPNN